MFYTHLRKHSNFRHVPNREIGFFKTEMESVYCAVGTESLLKTDYFSFLVCLKRRRAVMLYEARTEVLYLIDFQLVYKQQYDMTIRYHASAVCG